jgi:hypothetical protein
MNSDWIAIESQKQLDELLRSSWWHDICLREAHLFSRVQLVDGGALHDDDTLRLSLLFVAQYGSRPALQLLFEGVSLADLPLSELEPIGLLKHNSIEIYDESIPDSAIVIARRLRYRWCDSTYWTCEPGVALREAMTQVET